MGRERVQLTVYASVSRHNSDQDNEDDERWDTLRENIQTLVSLFPDIDADCVG